MLVTKGTVMPQLHQTRKEATKVATSNTTGLITSFEVFSDSTRCKKETRKKQNPTVLDLSAKIQIKRIVAGRKQMTKTVNSPRHYHTDFVCDQIC
jgi:hypothetical protein